MRWEGHGPNDALESDLAAVVDLSMDALVALHSWCVHGTLCLSEDTFHYIILLYSRVCLPH